MSLTHHINPMKLFTSIAAAAASSFIFIPSIRAQTTIAPTTFMQKSECFIQAGSSNGKCNFVMVTHGGGTSNIHFSKDKSGSYSMSFVIPETAFNPGQGTMQATELIFRNPTQSLVKMPGVCMITGSVFRCRTNDGKYSASAAN